MDQPSVKIRLALLGRDARAAVRDPQHRRTALGPQLDLDPGVRRAGGRVQRVVDEVADDRHQAARVHQPVGQQCPGRDAQRHAALRRHRRLADQQRGQQRVVDLLGDLLGGGPVHADHLGDELHRLLVHLQFEQPEQGVQPVGVLVVLGAQGVDQPAGGVQLAAELLQLGAVAQGGHGAAVVGRHPVGDQHPAAA